MIVEMIILGAVLTQSVFMGILIAKVNILQSKVDNINITQERIRSTQLERSIFPELKAPKLPTYREITILGRKIYREEEN